jgi:hypothetical protein
MKGKIIVVSREPGSMSIRQGDTRCFRRLQTWQDWYSHQGLFEAMYQKWMGPIFEGESTELSTASYAKRAESSSDMIAGCTRLPILTTLDASLP